MAQKMFEPAPRATRSEYQQHLRTVQRREKLRQIFKPKVLGKAQAFFKIIKKKTLNIWGTQIPAQAEADTPPAPKADNQEFVPDDELGRANENAFAKAFDLLRADPVGTSRSAFKNIENSIKEAKNNLPSFASKVFNKAIDKTVEFQTKSASYLKKKQKKFNANRLELNHPNVQGLELVQDKDNPEGYRFKATKNVTIPSGNKDIPGFKLEEGQTTGLIIPKGRKNIEALAQYSHGGKYIKLNLSPDSTLTMDNNLQNPDIFGSDIGQISNSEVTLSGNAELGKGNQIINAHHVEIANKLENTAIANSRNVKLYADVKDSSINHSFNFLTHGDINTSSFDMTSVENTGFGPIVASNISNSTIHQQDKNSLYGVAANNTTIIDSDILGFTDDKGQIIAPTNIDSGVYRNSEIHGANLAMSSTSQVMNSTISNTEIRHSDPVSSKTMIVDSDLDNVTMTADQNVQALNTVNLSHDLINGDVAIQNAEIDGSAENPNYIRNLSAQRMILDTKHTSAILADAQVDGKNNVYGDENIPSSMTVGDDQAAVKQFLQEVTGYSDRAPQPLQARQTDYGQVSPNDQINSIGRYLKPEENITKQKIEDFLKEQDVQVQHEAPKQPEIQNEPQETQDVPNEPENQPEQASQKSSQEEQRQDANISFADATDDPALYDDKAFEEEMNQPIDESNTITFEDEPQKPSTTNTIKFEDEPKPKKQTTEADEEKLKRDVKREKEQEAKPKETVEQKPTETVETPAQQPTMPKPENQPKQEVPKPQVAEPKPAQTEPAQDKQDDKREQVDMTDDEDEDSTISYEEEPTESTQPTQSTQAKQPKNTYDPTMDPNYWASMDQEVPPEQEDDAMGM